MKNLKSIIPKNPIGDSEIFMSFLQTDSEFNTEIWNMAIEGMLSEMTESIITNIFAEISDEECIEEELNLSKR